MNASKLVQNLRNVRLVTFDVTDTLLKFSDPPGIQYAKTAASCGFAHIKQSNLERNFPKHFKFMHKSYPNFGKDAIGMNWEEWWGNLVVGIFKDSGLNNIPGNELEKLAEKLIQQYKTAECWQEIDGATDLITKIRKARKTIGVISNFDPRLHEILINLKLPKFDFVLTSYEEGVLKPDSKIFEKALQLANARKDEALHIGNTLTLDYLGASNAGWKSVHISNGSESWRGNHSVKREMVFPTLRSFLAALETTDIEW